MHVDLADAEGARREGAVAGITCGYLLFFFLISLTYLKNSGRVDPGDYSPGPPSDPDVRD